MLRAVGDGRPRPRVPGRALRRQGQPGLRGLRAERDAVAVPRPLPEPMLALIQLSNYLILKSSFSAVSKPFFQVNIRWKALAEICKMHSFAPFSGLNFSFTC